MVFYQVGHGQVGRLTVRSRSRNGFAKREPTLTTLIRNHFYANSRVSVVGRKIDHEAVIARTNIRVDIRRRLRNVVV